MVMTITLTYVATPVPLFDHPEDDVSRKHHQHSSTERDVRQEPGAFRPQLVIAGGNESVHTGNQPAANRVWRNGPGAGSITM